MEFQKYNVEEKKKKSKEKKNKNKNKVTKIIKYIYMKFTLKSMVFFFCKVIVGYKMKIKGVIEDLKIKKTFLKIKE